MGDERVRLLGEDLQSIEVSLHPKQPPGEENKTSWMVPVPGQLDRNRIDLGSSRVRDKATNRARPQLMLKNPLGLECDRGRGRSVFPAQARNQFVHTPMAWGFRSNNPRLPRSTIPMNSLTLTRLYMELQPPCTGEAPTELVPGSEVHPENPTERTRPAPQFSKPRRARPSSSPECWRDWATKLKFSLSLSAPMIGPSAKRFRQAPGGPFLPRTTRGCTCTRPAIDCPRLRILRAPEGVERDTLV